MGPVLENDLLTVGILIAVFGMRLIFPVVIVAVTADMGVVEVAKMALNDPKTYSERLMAHHAEISAFGGTFLLLVFLNFFFDDEKKRIGLDGLNLNLQAWQAYRQCLYFLL